MKILGTWLTGDQSYMQKDRVVVITGAAGGIGAKIVDRFLSNHDTIFAIDNRADALRALGNTHGTSDRLVLVEGDVSKESDCQRLADTIRAKAGRVEVLVNCAGYYPVVSFEKMSFSDWQQVIGINFSGQFLTISNLLPLMKDRGWGRIVNISSGSIFEGSSRTDALCSGQERCHRLLAFPCDGIGSLWNNCQRESHPA